MSLAALQTHGIAPPSKTSHPGRPPKLEWLALSALRIDETYQRPVVERGRKTITAIVAQFSWSKFSPLIVAPVPGTSTFAVIDGQHRAAAALILGHDRVPCYVVDVGPEEQAKIFAAVNGTVTPMSILALFKAAKMAGEAWAVEIDRACRAAGIEACVYPIPKSKMKPFQTLAIGTLRKMWQRIGEKRLRDGLAEEAKRPGANLPGYFNSTSIARLAAGTWAAPKMTEPGSGEITEKIRWLKGKGYSTSYIAATLKVTYAQIEKALEGKA